MSKFGLIIEGLNQLRINEASNYNSKLGSFIGDESKEVQDSIKKVLNDLFLGLKKDGDGYIEGKKPTIKDYGKYKTMTMKIQTKQIVKGSGSGYSSNIAELYWKKYGKMLGSASLGTDSYSCVFLSLKDEGKDYDMKYSEYLNNTSPEKNVIVGIAKVGFPNSYANKYRSQKKPEDVYSGKYIDKSYRGNTYEVIISLPKVEDIDYEESNKYVSVSNGRSTFYNGVKNRNTAFDVEYNSKDGEFLIHTWDESQGRNGTSAYTILYKKNRNHFKAYKDLLIMFDGNTTKGDVEKIFADNNIKIEHSWYSWD